MNLTVALQQYSSLIEFLAFLGTLGGAQWFFGKFIARVLENWTAWHNFPKWIKKSAPMVIAVLVAVASQLALEYDVTSYIPEWFAVILLSVINQLSGQKEYQEIKDSTYGESTRIKAEEYLG